MGSLSRNNERTALAYAERAAEALRAAGFTVGKTTTFDLGGQCAVVLKNPYAVFYADEQIASGEAYRLEAEREIAA